MMVRLGDKLDYHHEKLMAIMKASHKQKEAMMENCLENTKAMDLEANPEEIEFKLLSSSHHNTHQAFSVFW
jgi:hypothetical protein